jgi:hypothetical protein
MKIRIYYIIAICAINIILSCKEDINVHLTPCDPSIRGNEVKFFSNQVGILTYTDSIAKNPLPNPKYFIFSQEITHLPLSPCNLPESEYKLTKGEQMNILFSGYVDAYPFSDALSVQIELTKVQVHKFSDE